MFPTELVDILRKIYRTQATTQALLTTAGVDDGGMEYGGGAVAFWTAIIYHALQQGGDTLRRIVARAAEEYPMREDLKAWLRRLEPSLTGGGSIVLPTGEWREPRIQIAPEALTAGVNTLQPISFLQAGLEAAKAVARITFRSAPGIEGAGTGFLTEDNLLITNNHVIATEEKARDAIIEFNYETDVYGRDKAAARFDLDPDGGFATSKQQDWTAVRLKGQPNDGWNPIPVCALDVTEFDYANIIQHPDAERKKVGLYHNVVVRVDPDQIQYLTDTLPGSSGSPVFVGNWRLAALHRGWVRVDLNVAIFGKAAVANIGIPATVLRRGLDEAKTRKQI